MSGRGDTNVEPKQEPMTPKQNNQGQGDGGGRGGSSRGGRGGGGPRRGGPNRFGGGRQGGGGGDDLKLGGGMDQRMDQRMDHQRMDQRQGGGGPRRGRGGYMSGGARNGEGLGMGGRSLDDRIQERLSAIAGPAYELPPVDTDEKKFSGRNRLYIGNLSSDITEEDIKEMFKPFGEINELFINKEKNFGFVRVDYRMNAEKAKRELDGSVRKGRNIKVRFAPNGATLRVKNLTQWVTNELLNVAFSVFGEIERCVVIADDHGKSTGEGLIEFARKPSAVTALRHCTDGCFFLTSSLRPVIAEMYEQMDMVDGFPEKTCNKKAPDFHRAREIGPRFAAMGSFEHEYGTRWKQLHELFKQKFDSLKQELLMEEDKLEAQMQLAKFESETEMLREQLRIREMDRERQKREWEERERAAEEARMRNEQMMRRQEEDLQLRMHHHDDDMRRRQQENTLFMQANQLSSLLDQQEQTLQSYGDEPTGAADAYDQLSAEGGGRGGSGDGGPPMDPKAFMNQYERNSRGGGGGGQGGYERERSWHRQSVGGAGGGGGRNDDFQNKRRRYQI